LAGLDEPEDVQSVFLTRQHAIYDGNAKVFLLRNDRTGLRSVPCQQHLMARVRGNMLKELAYRSIVIDDENRRHQALPPRTVRVKLPEVVKSGNSILESIKKLGG
jgi:hypothetical protein